MCVDNPRRVEAGEVILLVGVQFICKDYLERVAAGLEPAGVWSSRLLSADELPISRTTPVDSTWPRRSPWHLVEAWREQIEAQERSVTSQREEPDQKRASALCFLGAPRRLTVELCQIKRRRNSPVGVPVESIWYGGMCWSDHDI